MAEPAAGTDLPPNEHDAPRRRVTLAELATHHDELHAIARRHGVSNVRVFGSVARGEADEHSDVDLLVDVEPGCGLLALAAFALDIEDMLGVFTQVVTEKGLKRRIRERVLGEAVAV